MLSQSTWEILLIVSCVAAILFLYVGYVLNHEETGTIRVTNIEKYRCGDLITDGKDVFKVRAIRAPDTLIVTRKD